MKTKIIICPSCNSSFIVTSKHWNQKFCSRKCTNNGKFSAHWKGGRYIDTYGYVRIKSRNHPYRDKQGYVCEHRLRIEQLLGRYLLPEEQTHHKNGIKDDNRLENLEIYFASEHRTKHNLENNPFKGKKHTEEYKRKMSGIMKLRWKEGFTGRWAIL